MGAQSEDIERHLLTMHQTCCVKLDDVFDTRRRIAAASPRLEQMVPLGAVLAHLERFADADAIYRQAFDAYDGAPQLVVVEPFGAGSELAALQLFDDEMEPFDPRLRLAETGMLRCERSHQFLQRLNIIRQGGEVDVHKGGV